jgi:excisionase family DNA binding protein
MNKTASQINKNLLRKFASTNLLLLEEVANNLKVDTDYLIKLIRSGKIKAFKVGNDWFIEESWLEDFRMAIKSSLKLEIEKENFCDYPSKFFKKLKKNKRKKNNFSYIINVVNGSFKMVITSLFLALIPFLLLILFFTVAVFDNNKQLVAEKFLTLSHNFYSTPFAGLYYIKNNNNEFTRINDDGLTELFNDIFLGFKNNINRSGRVAGEMESEID